MNPPASSTSPPGTATPVATTLVSTAPPRYQSFINMLIALGIGITSILGMLTLAEELAPQYAGYAAGITGILVGVLRLAVAFGDFFDNGLMDGSFDFGGKVKPEVMKRWLGLLAALLLPAFMLASCVTSKMTQGQLSLADIGYTAAQGAVIIAEASLAEKMADPKTPAWQVLASQIAFKQARKTLDREQAKLDAAFAALLAGKVPSDLAMPTYTSAKAAVPVLP